MSGKLRSISHFLLLPHTVVVLRCGWGPGVRKLRKQRVDSSTRLRASVVCTSARIFYMQTPSPPAGPCLCGNPYPKGVACKSYVTFVVMETNTGGRFVFKQAYIQHVCFLVTGRKNCPLIEKKNGYASPPEGYWRQCRRLRGRRGK